MTNSAATYTCPMPPVPAFAASNDPTLCDDCQDAPMVAGGRCQDCIDQVTADRTSERAMFTGSAR